MRNYFRLLISCTLLLASLSSFGCTATFQIGGKQNTSEQNRQAPVTIRTEQSSPPPQAPQPTPDQQRTDDAEAQQQRQAEQEQLEEQRRIVGDQRAQLENERRAQQEDRQRLQQDAARLEQQQLAQQVNNLEQTRRSEEQKLAEVRSQRAREQERLSETQQPAEVLRTISNWPTQQRILVRNPTTLSGRVLYPNESLSREKEKKGHSTRDKIIGASILAGGVLLGVHLSKKRH